MRPRSRLVISVSVFEPVELVEQLVLNYLRFTGGGTMILLHASLATNYNFSDPTWTSILEHPRLALNVERCAPAASGSRAVPPTLCVAHRPRLDSRASCARAAVYTSWCHPGIFLAHLSNAMYAAERSHKHAVFLPMSSNSFFFRAGVEERVKEMSGMSLCPGSPDLGLSKLSFPNRHVDKRLLPMITGNPMATNVNYDKLECFYPLAWFTDVAAFFKAADLPYDQRTRSCEEDWVMSTIAMHNSRTHIIKSARVPLPEARPGELTCSPRDRCIGFRIPTPGKQEGLSLQQIIAATTRNHSAFYAIKQIGRQYTNRARQMLSGMGKRKTPPWVLNLTAHTGPSPP